MKAEEQKSRLYFLIFGIALTVLANVPNAVFLWPISHLGSLLFFATCLSLLAFYYFRHSRWALDSTVPFFLLFGVFVANYFIPPAPDVEVVGVLRPSAEPTPPNGCDRQTLGPETLKILIGDNAVTRDGLGRVNAIQVGKCPVLAFERTADGVSPIVDLYDAAGRHIADIHRGEFHALSGDTHFVDRRGDLSTLAITDRSWATLLSHGRALELLYVRYLNPTTVQARGIFGCPGHAPVVVKPQEPIPGQYITGLCTDAETGIAIR